MDEAWQDKLPEPKIRNLLKRTLEDLRVARDRLNQNPGNSSRPSGSMPPWLGGDDKTKDADKALMDKQDEYAGQHKNPQEDDTAAPEPAKDTKPVSDKTLQVPPGRVTHQPPWRHLQPNGPDAPKELLASDAPKSSHPRNLSTNTPRSAPGACAPSRQTTQPKPGRPGTRWNCGC